MSDPDAPSLAQSTVVHAGRLCEDHDHLSAVMEDLVVPIEGLTDAYTRKDDDTFDFEAMLKAFIYREIRGFSDSELTRHLERRTTTLCSWLGLDRAPSQGSLSYAWRKRFGNAERRFIKATANGIAAEAVDHGVISEELVATEPARNDLDDEGDPSTEYKREQALKATRLAKRYAHQVFNTTRAENKTYSDPAIFDMHARICAYHGSAHEEGQYGSLVDVDDTCHNTTFLRALKQLQADVDEEDGPDSGYDTSSTGTHSEQSDDQRSLDDFVQDEDQPDSELPEMHKIEQIREDVLGVFNNATEHILKAISEEGLFENREVKAAIDITTEQFYPSPWEDKDEEIPKEDYPKMVSGYKEDNEYKRGYKYATITLVGNFTPIIIGIAPVKENSNWEPDDAASYSKAATVERLLDRAQQYIDIDTVMFDRGFDSHDTYAAVDDRDITYIAPRPTYEEDYQNIQKIREADDADAAVQPDVDLYIDGEVHHEVQFLYVPSREQEGQYAVFVTNHDQVTPREIFHVVGKYRRRWDIENQYKLVKEFLPTTSSTNYRVRLSNFMVACLIHNLWRLTDYLLKLRLDRAVRDKPELTMGMFSRVVGDFLRITG